MTDRRSQIIEIAKQNALEGLDQGRIEDYNDNMRDTIAELFPDWTAEEVALAEVTFDEIVSRPS